MCHLEQKTCVHFVHKVDNTSFVFGHGNFVVVVGYFLCIEPPIPILMSRRRYSYSFRAILPPTHTDKKKNKKTKTMKHFEIAYCWKRLMKNRMIRPVNKWDFNRNIIDCSEFFFFFASFVIIPKHRKIHFLFVSTSPYSASPCPIDILSLLLGWLLLIFKLWFIVIVLREPFFFFFYSQCNAQATCWYICFFHLWNKSFVWMNIFVIWI